MHISRIQAPVKKKDHDEKFGAHALFVDDLQDKVYLYAKAVRSPVPHGKIKSIEFPELPEGCYKVTMDDVPQNGVVVIQADQPVFAGDVVRYIGECICLIVAPTQRMADELAAEVKIDIEELEPDPELRKGNEIAHEYRYETGDVERAFAEAVDIFEETFETGYQEQAYIEPQGMIAEWEDGIMTVKGSLQCPYYVQTSIKHAFKLDDQHVRIIQMATGGGFGGKEDYPSVIGCQVAAAAYAIGKPVKMIYRRQEDMEVTTKRHPSKSTYRTALDKDGNILAMDIDVMFNGGAYPGLSSVVLQRGLICATSVYTIPAVRALGTINLTNTVPNGAYRGFGAPQTTFAMEQHMAHLAKHVGQDVLDFRLKYVAKQGDHTSTGGKHSTKIVMPELIDRVLKKSDYRNKVEQFKNQTGRYRRGIGFAMFSHGCGFTGSAERDLLKSVAHLYKHADNRVEVRVANTDIGQGIKTTLCKIVADTLDIPLERVFCNNPDTFIVPDSGPTVASRSLMIVGRLIQRAAIRMKEEWEDGVEKLYEEHFIEEPTTIAWDITKFFGDAYPTYSWGVYALETIVDTVTAKTELVKLWGAYDIGTPGDETIAMGQMMGGLTQGLAYGSIEDMVAVDGKIKQNAFNSYNIPTSSDICDFDLEFVNNPYEWGPYGAKGAGELPLNGGAPVYTQSIENALGADVMKIPCTVEEVMELL